MTGSADGSKPPTVMSDVATTRCPACLTVFAVTAVQLGAAGGKVRCGRCLTVFDGRIHRNRPTGAEGASPGEGAGSTGGVFAGPPAPDVSAGTDPVAVGPAPVGAAPASGEAPVAAVGPAAGVADAEPRALAPGPGGESEAGPTPGQGEGIPAPAAEIAAPSSSRSAVSGGSESVRPDVEIPAVLRDDLERIARARRGRWGRLATGFLALIALALLAGQFAWFMPESLLAAYPQSRPLVEAGCARFGCRLPERRAPEQFRILDRDVRVHPRYEGALKVTATLTNAAPWAQPYPRLELTLFNVNGQPLAGRFFVPEEYLGRSLGPGERMAAAARVQVALELLSPDEAAVSFEFRFH